MGDLLPCQNGYIAFQINESHQWQSFVQMLGNPEWAQGKGFEDPYECASRYPTEIKPHVAEWAKNHAKEDIYHEGQANNCPFADVMSAADVVNSEHLQERGFFVDIDHPLAGRIRYPGAPAKFSETPWSIDNPAPLLGQHNEQIYCGWLGYSKNQLVKMRGEGII